MSLPVPNPPVETQKPGIPGLVAGVENEVYEIRRALAGYNRLNDVWTQMTRGVAPGDRVLGIPLFTYTASDECSDSNEAIKCVVDLRKLADAKHAPMVLAAFCQIHAKEILDTVDRMYKHVDTLRQQVYDALGINRVVPVAPAAHVAAGGPNEAVEDEAFVQEVAQTVASHRPRSRE